MKDASESALVKASFKFAKAFGWTPRQVQEMTYGQINLYLELLKDDSVNNE